MIERYGNRVFYVVILTISIIGAAQTARGWLNWWLLPSLIAVSAIELGGVVLSLHADRRRRLGERAIPARVLSAAVAAGAVAVNWFGHGVTGQAAFFAGASALGYTFWLIDSASRRRDALRKSRKLGHVAPIYGWLTWVQHPALTYRARGLALVTPSLGKIGSMLAATAEIRTERRNAAIAKALRSRVAASVDPTMATIAVNVLDLGQIAERLTHGADYEGFTSLLAADLSPRLLHQASAPIVADVPTQRADEPSGREAVVGSAATPRKPRSAWDAHRVVRMILDGESDDTIKDREDGVSQQSLYRFRRVIRILQANPRIEIEAKEKVRADIVQFIRTEVGK